MNHPDSCSRRVCVLAENLETIKKSVFVLKEGVDYKIKITFKVRLAAEGASFNGRLEQKVTSDAFHRSTRRSSQA